VTRGIDNFRPIYEMSLAHYRDRMGVPSDDYKWLQRGHDLFVQEIGVETEGVVTDHPVYGSLAFRRVSPGDPVSGFDDDGLPLFAMNMLPGTVEAENFDYFPTEAGGQGRTYSDTTPGNQGGEYRLDSDVDIEQDTEGFHIGQTQAGEFLTYTVHVPETGFYDLRVRVGSTSNAGIRISIDGDDKTGVVTIPSTGGFEDFETISVAEQVPLTQGVQQVRLDMLGTFTLDNFSVTDFLLGDINRDGQINFLDITPFISLLSSGMFQDEGDINGDGAVNFLDIRPFISLLSGG